jgi:AcrR family transcriptional regulator
MAEAVVPRLWAAPEDLLSGRSYGPRHLELLDGIETILLTEGFRDLTVGGLAQRLHCSRRTLYELADSKEDLVLLVIDRLMRRLARRAHDSALTETTYLDRLRAFLTKGLIEFHRVTLTFAEDVAADEAAHALVSTHFRFGINVVVGMLTEGIEAGEFAATIHPRVAAEVLDAGLARLQEPTALRTTGVTFAEAIEEFLTLFTDGIRAGASS